MIIRRRSIEELSFCYLTVVVMCCCLSFCIGNKLAGVIGTILQLIILLMCCFYRL